MNPTITILLAAASLTGCVSALNERNAVNHANAAWSPQRRGDWDTARRQFAQAVVNANLGNLDVDTKARLSYEYGRALGVTCYYKLSEETLLRSKSLSLQAGKPPYLALLELAFLSDRQAIHQKSIEYYSELLPMVEKEGIRTTYPLGVAEAYSRYGAALDALGRSSEGKVARDASARIREANPSAKPSGSVTPYGSACKDA